MKIIHAEDIQSHFNIAIVVSRFNEDITERLLSGALERLKELEFEEKHITVAWVPGAVEIPITAQRFANTKKYEVIICLGAVIQGDTDHYQYVCEQVNQGCQRVALSHNIPLIFGVLTTKNKEQALERVDGPSHHGRSSADAAYEMVSVLRQIEILSSL